MDVAVEAMEESEREAFRRGAMRGLIDKIEAMADNRNVGQKLIESTRAKEILRLAFPDEDAFNEFVRKATSEARFTETRNAVLYGSRTTPLQQDIQGLNQMAGVGQAMASGGDPAALTISFLRNLGFGEVSDETLEEVAKLLFARDLPQKTIDRIAPGAARQADAMVRQGRIVGGTQPLANQGEE